MTAAAGPYAAALDRLFWFFVITCAVVFVLVAIMVVVAIAKGLRRTEPDESVDGMRSSARWVGIAVGITTLVLLSMIVVSTAAGRAVSPAGDAATREIEITGHQWWWSVKYLDPRADRVMETANELHLPAGERVKIILRSSDVIHSFWVPRLHGKRDLIPGKDAIFTIQADAPGVYRGQCAEFCGLQHAKMGLTVIVESRDSFEHWLNAQLLPAPHPKTADEQRGQQVFLLTTCVMCHTIRGTSAGARTGPDLTHLGSRLTLGASAIPNTTGNLHGWISNAQSIKPGVVMPPNTFDPEDLHALVAYLESLK